MTRDELNEKAKGLGIENPEDLPSSQAVKDAIKAARQAEAGDAPDDAEPEVTAFDLIGADGRKVLRRVSRTWAEEEAARISALTGETFDIQPASPFYNTTLDEPS